eukprot:Gb_25990 [translate_table: standard]
MAGGGGGESRSLEETPTWAVAVVCLGFILVSILIEQAIHLIGKALRKRRKKSLNEALEKIKAELMLLGFISLLLTVGQERISKICISKSLGDSMLPCKNNAYEETEIHNGEKALSEGYHRKLLWGSSLGSFTTSSYEGLPLRRFLAAAGGSDHCAGKGKVSLISQDGLHQLHIFIFVLAVFHVIYCILTMALGKAKMRRWKAWEQETTTAEYEFSHDPARFRFTRQTTFGRRHMSFWSRNPVLIWIVCFFRQFVRSVPKVDYLTLRHGFILAHLAPHSKFDFQKYIKRSLEDDFKVIVGINPFLWFFAVLFLLLNAHGWYTYFWLSFVPLIIIVIVGTKLQVIIIKMALEIQDTNPVVKGAPVVRPSDELFWFGRPHWVLYLIHFTLFQNAIQLAFFFWAWYEYGLRSCFHERIEDIVIRVVMGIGVQVLCSYVTLPLYALVTHMGANMKIAIFDERTANALRRWHQTARRNLKRKMRSSQVSPSGFTSGQTTPTRGFSPMHLLHKFKSSGDLIESAQVSPRLYQSDHEISDLETPEASPSTSHHSRHVYSTTMVEHNKEAAMRDANTEDTARAPRNMERDEKHPTTTQDRHVDINSTEFTFVKL